MYIKREEQYILIAALGLYVLNKYYLREALTNDFMRCYFNDIMGGVVFGIIIRVANRFWFKREITVWSYGLLFIIAGVYWECIAPLYIKYSVGDVGDIAAYSGGGLCLALLLKILGGREMKCQNCGKELNETAKFCPFCGKEVKRYCTECGKEIAPTTRFCLSCGKPVVRENAEEKKDKQGIADDSMENQKVVLVQDDLEEQQDEMTHEDDSVWQMKVGIPDAVVRTKETFLAELKQLVQEDKESKDVFNYYGEKVFIKHVFPVLNNNEKVLKLRHIVHHNYANTFMRGGIINTKEFLLITNERIIKFVKSLWLKPKIKSCYLSQINSIIEAKPGGRIHGVFVGEKLKINSTVGLITMRTMGRGSAYQAKLEIMQAMKDNYGENIVEGQETELSNNISEYTRNKKKKVFPKLIVGIVVVFVVGLAILIWLGSGTDLSECISLSKEEVIQFAAEQGLEGESEAGLYYADGLMIILDERGKIDSFSLESPEYNFYGLKVGDEFTVLKDGKKLSNHRFDFLTDLKGVSENRLYYGIIGKNTPGNGRMIEICLDKDNRITNISYSRSGANEIVEGLEEWGNGNFDDSYIEDNEETNVELGVVEGMFIPGTYSAEVRGMKVITVTTVFSQDRIENIQVDHEETADIGGAAVDVIKKQILEQQSLAVDAVSGATLTSNAIVDGVAECAKQAGADVEALKEKTKSRWEQIQETAGEQYSSQKEDDIKNLAKQYEGEWWDLNSQRCYMNINAIGGNKLSIVVSWSSGYADDSKWEMTGQINGRNGKIVYNDCTQYDIHSSEYGEDQKIVNYTNGSGYFYPGNDGYLYWEDEVEYAGSGCYFEKDDWSVGTTNAASEYILPDSSSRYLTESDLIGLDKSALRLARNEIYARHGRRFQTDDLNTYFNSKSWYYGYLSAEEFDDSVLNVYEKANLELIKKMEN